MTKKEWTCVEEALSGLIGSVELLVNGRNVLLQRAQIKNRLVVAVYVDRTMKGVWIGRENEYPEQRFLYPKQCYRYCAKHRRALKKISRARLKKYGIDDPNERWTLWSPFFPSVSAVRRHYTKTFSEIELVDVIRVPHWNTVR